MRELLLRKCIFELTTPQCHMQGCISTILVDRPENQFFYNREYLGVTNSQKSSVPGHGYFFQARTTSLVGKESHIWSISECHVKSKMANCVNFARRMRLPALHFQLDDHIPTMASYQTSTISLGVQPPPKDVSRTTSSLELRLAIVWGKWTRQWGQWGY